MIPPLHGRSSFLTSVCRVSPFVRVSLAFKGQVPCDAVWTHPKYQTGFVTLVATTSVFVINSIVINQCTLFLTFPVSIHAFLWLDCRRIKNSIFIFVANSVAWTVEGWHQLWHERCSVWAFPLTVITEKMCKTFSLSQGSRPYFTKQKLFISILCYTYSFQSSLLLWRKKENINIVVWSGEGSVPLFVRSIKKNVEPR